MDDDSTPDRAANTDAPEPRDPDAAWLDDWRAGRHREQRFQQLFDRHAGAVYGFFRRRGFAPDVCDDLVQETFLAAYRGLSRFRGDVPFRLWLFEIAANAYRKALRHAAAQKRAADETSFDDERSPQATRSWALSRLPAPIAMRRLLGRERLAQVGAGLLEMPPQMRRCAELGWYHGLSHREIAERLGVSPQTVKVQLFRARRKLVSGRGDDR